MSNDLISRSALLEIINSYHTHTPDDSPEHYAYGVVLNELKAVPTAFDKEKVRWEICNVPHGYYNVETENEIMEIIEKGGIE